MEKKHVESIALSVRSLTMDAVQAANSGHPGMPMGMAEFGALLYGDILRYNSQDPAWPNRDRFVLSAGHGSLFLYSLLHLAGFDLSLDDIRRFRQLDSRTPGHPEYGHTPGVETTTGPLGQGVANAVGMAMAERYLAARFNTPEHCIVDHYTYVLAGDGCLMEGISSEASSLAGHQQLHKLMMFYDSNKISIDGSTDITFTEDVAARYRAYGWQVMEVNAYDSSATGQAIAEAKNNTEAPTLIILDSIIAKGSANKEGSHKAHGAALGVEEVALTKKSLGLDPDKHFYIHPDAEQYFHQQRQKLQEKYNEWQDVFTEWKQKNPGLFAEWEESYNRDLRTLMTAIAFPAYQVGQNIATRKVSEECIAAISRLVPHFIGGSADLAASNNSDIPDQDICDAAHPRGKNIRFGVREHAMGGICNGLALHEGLRPFCATFLVFSDYMRPAIRLAALMQLPVSYIFTHDSIHLGEDGPTHQPVEHLAALRAIPGLRVMRPADAEETVEAWRMALNDSRPTCLVLSRQNLPVLQKSSDWKDDLCHGAYILQKAARPKLLLIATGSELSLAVEAGKQISEQASAPISADEIQIVSMPCREQFLAAAPEFRNKLLPADVPIIVVEAGVPQGWDVFGGTVLGLTQFGASGPGQEVAQKFALDTQSLIECMHRVLQQ